MQHKTKLAIAIAYFFTLILLNSTLLIYFIADESTVAISHAPALISKEAKNNVAALSTIPTTKENAQLSLTENTASKNSNRVRVSRSTSSRNTARDSTAQNNQSNNLADSPSQNNLISNSPIIPLSQNNLQTNQQNAFSSFTTASSGNTNTNSNQNINSNPSTQNNNQNTAANQPAQFQTTQSFSTAAQSFQAILMPTLIPQADLKLFEKDMVGYLQAHNEVRLLAHTDEEIANAVAHGCSIATDAVTVKAMLCSKDVEQELGLEEDPIFHTAGSITNTQIGADKIHLAGNTGKGRRVAVLDSGIDYNHPELKPNYITGYNFIAKNNDPMDDNGHGTSVAGVVAAKGINPLAKGTAPDAGLIVGKVIDAQGVTYGTELMNAIYWAVNGPDGKYGTADDFKVDAISMSVGGIPFNDFCDNAYNGDMTKAIKYARDRGILVVVAAGNRATDGVYFPGCVSYATTVGAVDEFDNIIGSSGRGPQVDITAPSYGTFTGVGGGYGTGLGLTSSATPVISGVVALIKSAHPNYNAEQVEESLFTTAKDLGPAGKDNAYGWGRVDAFAAVNHVSGLPAPTASIVIGKNNDVDNFNYLNANSHEITAEVNNQIFFNWIATNADKASISYTVDSQDSCASNPFKILADDISKEPFFGTSYSQGNNNIILDQCQSDKTYTIKYTATQSSTGKTAQDTVIVHVKGIPTFTPDAVTNAASFSSQGIVPGSIITIFGKYLTTDLNGIVQASSLPLPTQLKGTSVKINGEIAPIFAIANVNGLEQINLQVPREIRRQGVTTAQIQVTRDGNFNKIIRPVTVSLLQSQPGIFTVGGNNGAILDINNNLVSESNPAHPNDVVVIFATGLGSVSNEPATGTPALSNPLSTTSTKPIVTINGQNANVLFSGLAPGFVGLYQINAQLPLTLQDGSNELVVTINGQSSNTAKIFVSQNSNSQAQSQGLSRGWCYEDVCTSLSSINSMIDLSSLKTNNEKTTQNNPAPTNNPTPIPINPTTIPNAPITQPTNTPNINPEQNVAPVIKTPSLKLSPNPVSIGSYRDLTIENAEPNSDVFLYCQDPNGNEKCNGLNAGRTDSNGFFTEHSLVTSDFELGQWCAYAKVADKTSNTDCYTLTASQSAPSEETPQAEVAEDSS